MLRRCRLCARQLQSSRSLALSARHRPKNDNSQHEQEQQQPIASTSKHVFEAAWTSTLPRCLQRRRNHTAAATATLSAQETENRFQHDFRSSSRSNNSKALASSNSTTTSLWKGKARAVEDEASEATPVHKEESPFAKLLQPPADSASADRPTSSSYIDPAVASIPQIRESIEHFEALLQQGDYIACFLAVVQDCLHASQTSRPHSMDEIRHRIQRMQDTFSHRARTETLSLLTPELLGLDEEVLHFEAIVPLLFRAVLEQDVYRQWRIRLQQLLKRIIPYLHQQSFARADACLAAVMSEFKTRRRWESIEQVGRLANTFLGRWTTATLSPYLDAIDRLERHHLAPTIDSLPSDMQPFPSDSRIYDYLLKCHLSNRNLAAAKAVLDAMTAAGITPTQRTFEFVYSGYRPLGGYSTFLDDAKQLNLAPSRQLINHVLESLIREEGLAAGIEAVDSLPQIAAERVQAALGSVDAPSGIADRSTSLVSAGTDLATANANDLAIETQPDRSTYGLMMRAYAAAGDFDKALDTYTEMLAEGYTPNGFTQAALAAAYRLPRTTSLDEHEKSLSLLSNNPITEVQTKTFRSRLPMIIENEGIEGVLRSVAEMNSKSVRLDDRSISVIFNAIAKAGLAKPADLSKFLVKLRHAHGSSYKVTDVNVLIQSFIASEGQSQSKHSWRPLQIPFAPDPLVNQSAAAQFHEIVMQLSLQGSRPDAYTMMLIMKRYADKGGSPRTLWEFFRSQFLDQGFKPNAHHISALMLAFVNAGDVYGARRAMDRGIALGVKPTQQHYTILINYFMKVRESSAARAVVREMNDQNIQSDIYVLTTLADYDAKRGDLSSVKQFESEAQSRFPDEAWPNPAFETIKFQCRLQQRAPLIALSKLKSLLETYSLMPDKQMLSAIDSTRRAARNAMNKSDENGRAHTEAKKILEVANEVWWLARKSMRHDNPRKEQAQMKKQLKRLLESLNENREVAGDYDFEQYEVKQEPKMEPLEAGHAQDLVPVKHLGKDSPH